ncbi:phage tail tape measure protein [Pseudomonas sp. B21-040]|uniref:phage tail tape measure protein n=1 Tax=Pseudomonas sp. B21-040 TaxID=2895486 RepID=UPI00215FB5E8|nr:phage tail tape measure protein [Pseudomonas sp. B21-040]UVL42379.1 phage tail tape measure protein [Pseudomonas sp. B21-040]
MANDLKLRVLLSAIDKATRPLKAINHGSIGAARALKEARDSLKALNAQQKDISAWRTQRAAAEHTEQALGAARDKVKALSQQFSAMGAPTKAMTKDFRAAVREAQKLKQQHQFNSEQLQSLRGRLNAAGISTKSLGDHERQLREQVRATNHSISEQTKRLAALGTQQRRLAAARATFDKSKHLASDMAGKGAAATAGGGTTLYAGAKLLTPGIDFDASMSKVQAITRLDKNAQALRAMRKQARELGGKTQFTAGQAADAQGFLGMAGFEPTAIKAAMPGMLDLAAAGGADLAQTADIASNILSGLGMSAGQMGKLGDVLVGTFTRSNTNLQMLGETMKYAAPMAKTYGVELEVAAAMAGKLGDAGLQGSMGGTALSSIMNRLAAPPKAAEKALQLLNITTADAHGNLRNLPDILKEIYDKTKDLGTASKGGLFKAIAGEEAVKGMAQLVEQAGTGELQKLIVSLRQSQGEASQTASVMADNFKGDLKTLSSAWEDLGIEIQTQQDGPLRGLIQSVTEVIQGIKSWANENPNLAAGLVKTIAIIAALAIVLGGLLMATASVLLPFAALRLMFALMGIRLPGLISLLWKLGRFVLPFVGKALLMLGRALMLNPIGLAITAIAAAAYLIYQNWDAVKAYFTDAWKEIKAGFNGGTRGILKTLANFSPIGLLYQAFSAVMKYLGIELPSRFTEFGAMIIDGLVSGLSAGFGKLKGVMGEISDSTIGWFKEKLGIQSPSRVFAELGGFTMAGLAQGLERSQNEPIGVMADVSGQLMATTRAITLAQNTRPSSLTVDNRAPLKPVQRPAYDSHDTYEITIHSTQGMDPLAIGRAVRAELTRVQYEKDARQRSRLADLE